MNDETDQNQETAGDESQAWFECDDGWGTLIAELETRLKALSPDYAISQVKEKFGGLRYYATPATSMRRPRSSSTTSSVRPRPSPTRSASAAASPVASRGEANTVGTRRSARRAQAS